MKVKVKQGITGFSGKLDGLVYYYHPRLKRTLARHKPKMPALPQNATYTTVSRRLKELNPSEAYRYDFKIYASLLRDQDESLLVPSWYPLFTRMMWAMQKKYPETVDLRAITREQVLSQDLPCRSVRAAIEDGLLAPVSNWELLDHSL
ncbi:MAG: hypothetical protein K0B87_05805 [Candidatus Syntrophosphaera sp.]|nr:hypothetical protein [Candidatus Syntrophosphaera sp.]